jgi:predicted glycoside hydrolase/deacetylase ChbG (UPF0249 family)
MAASAPRALIVNADDFGQSPGVNRGVATAHERGIVTSASLMVRWPAAGPVAAYARAHASLSLGLHIDLGEWVFRRRRWVPLYEVVPVEDAAAVADEVARQLTTFWRLVGREPTHIDSHQHVHQKEPVRTVLLEAASRLGVPLRGCSPVVRYVGDFYGRTAEGAPLPGHISVEHLIALLQALPTGLTELGCHPGLSHDLKSVYRSERAKEVHVLCDTRVQQAVDALGIQLRGF